MYLWLDVKYTVNGKPKGSSHGTPCKSLDDAIAQITARILADHPTAKNIVITEQPKNKGKPLLIDELIQRIKNERPDISDELIKSTEFMLLVNPGRDEYREGGYWRNLVDAKKEFDEPWPEYVDWVYIRRWGIVLFNVGHHTSHEMFMANWDWILSDMLDNPTLDFDDMPDREPGKHAENYLHNCHGFFSSRVAYGGVTKSTNMKLNAAERIAFAGMKFRELEPE